MTNNNILAVIPSVRDFPLDYLMPLKNVDIMIIDDSKNPRKKAIKQPDWHNKNFQVVTHADRDKMLHPLVNMLIPKGSPSCKNVGLYLSYVGKYEITILLDDDCNLMHDPDYVNKIPIGKQSLMKQVKAGKSEYPWFNPMSLFSLSQYSRGFPYYARGDLNNMTTKEVSVPANSKFNEGLWFGTPDTNGIDKYGISIEDYTIMPTRPDNVVVSPGLYVPISIMNCQIDNKLIPAFFQPPDFLLYGDFYVRRHDDVWAGMFLKTLMDVAGDDFTVGNPMIEHIKTPDPFKEAKAETITNFVQPELERVLNIGRRYVSPDTYKNMAVRLSDACSRALTFSEFKYPEILSQYFKLTRSWALLFPH